MPPRILDPFNRKNESFGFQMLETDGNREINMHATYNQAVNMIFTGEDNNLSKWIMRIEGCEQMSKKNDFFESLCESSFFNCIYEIQLCRKI